MIAYAMVVCLCPPPTADIKPAMVLSGSHSAIKEEGSHVVTDEAGWKKLWARHRGKNPVFTETSQSVSIDFGTYYVVAVFTGTDSDLAVTTLARGDAVLVRYAALGRQTEGVPLGGNNPRPEREEAKEAAAADYCFVVLSKPIREVIVEKDVRRQLDDPPLWKEQTRFEVPPK